MLLNLTFESTLIKHLSVGAPTQQKNYLHLDNFSVNLYQMIEELKNTHTFQGKDVLSFGGIVTDETFQKSSLQGNTYLSTCMM